MASKIFDDADYSKTTTALVLNLIIAILEHSLKNIDDYFLVTIAKGKQNAKNASPNWLLQGVAGEVAGLPYFIANFLWVLLHQAAAVLALFQASNLVAGADFRKGVAAATAAFITFSFVLDLITSACRNVTRRNPDLHRVAV